MTHLKKLGAIGPILLLTLCGVPSQGQGDPGTMIKEKLVSEIKLTKAAADHSDIVTAGDVVVLHKDGLMMCSSASSYAFSNTYQNGVLSASLKNRAKDAIKHFGLGALTGGASAADSANNGCPSRKFVAGEKFWVTDIQLQKDGILMSTFSDPYNDVRYYGEIKFFFPKGSVPPVDTMVKTVEEVVTVAPAEDDKSDKAEKKDAAPAQSAAAAPAPAAAALAPIPPPPPPTDAPPPPPKTISKGQTRDVVVATWGEPSKDIKLGTKEILVYPDMKVTFVAGKVSDVQ